VTGLSPITIELVSESLISIVREMRGIVFRTARSVAIYEAKDFSCGLFTPAGEVLAQSEDIGGHIIPLPWHVRAVLERFRDNIAPGDTFMLNDPYVGGTHLNDVTLVAPVFWRGELAFIAAVREHWSDVGGSVPGSLSGAARDIYQEGIRIPVVKIIDKHVLNDAAFDILLANMRVRDDRRADFYSGIAACRTAETRLLRVIESTGIETVGLAMRANIERSEIRMREQIRRIPPGIYEFEDYLETFTPNGLETLIVPVTLTVEGDSVVADFTGASAQVAAPVNTTLAVTSGGVIIALKSILDPSMATNHGVFRPVSIVAPPGTVLNATAPAPVGSHGEVRKRVMGVVFGALSRAVPDLVPADTQRTSFHNMIGGNGIYGEYVHYELGSGGNGAYSTGDGASAMGAVDWGGLYTVQSTEVLERSFPIRIEQSSLAQDSGGAGRFRGGLAMKRDIRVLGEARYSLLADGAVIPPYGVNGGLSAMGVHAEVRKGDHTVQFSTPGKVGGFELSPQDVVVTRAGGGGGYGDPLDRPANLVRHDVVEGYISHAAAKADYGVVLTTGDIVAIEETELLRRRLREGRVHLIVEPHDCDDFQITTHGKRRLVRLHPGDIASLGATAGSLVEIAPASGAPLRGWCILAETTRRGTLPLSRRTMQALTCAEGAPVSVRRLQRVSL